MAKRKRFLIPFSHSPFSPFRPWAFCFICIAATLLSEQLDTFHCLFMAWSGGMSQRKNHILATDLALITFDLGNNIVRRTAEQPIRRHAIERPLGI